MTSTTVTILTCCPLIFLSKSQVKLSAREKKKGTAVYEIKFISRLDNLLWLSKNPYDQNPYPYLPLCLAAHAVLAILWVSLITTQNQANLGNKWKQNKTKQKKQNAMRKKGEKNPKNQTNIMLCFFMSFKFPWSSRSLCSRISRYGVCFFITTNHFPSFLPSSNTNRLTLSDQHSWWR